MRCFKEFKSGLSHAIVTIHLSHKSQNDMIWLYGLIIAIRNVDVIVAIYLWHKSNAILAIQHP